MSNTIGVRGTLYIVSAPSGAGKTSLVRALIASDSATRLSVSHTTREQRPGEIDGDHYYFVTEQCFQAMCERGEFLEHAQVFNNYYGTSRQAVAALLEQGLDVVLEIDWQGARQVRAAAGNTISIFVLPPSLEQLESRLRHRARDDAKAIKRRMQAARDELSHYHEFDYLVVNDHFDTALEQVRAVVQAQRLRLQPQIERHGELLASLLGSDRHD